ncbi:hypothetical protein BRADO5678 [Bradyrhizobium sp. ORS 278]|uniref:hypothetical protein n=1 Tax=Bradyrhizobium sp. (strain ORS 278) TaxID=114615 RepID=UPI0001507F9C|nr:hypothetical protein [Bradyrhizobium sp. ORS 278]CAL79347.1 hypothetical protein BRADO5678 [Bradyrhizobium sp. ORS 278]
MASYRIKAIGMGFEVSTEEHPVLLCRSLKIARRAVADAQRLARLPPKPIPWRVPPQADAALGTPDTSRSDHADLDIAILLDGPPPCG